MHQRRKWQPTPVFLPGESQERGSLVGCHPWDATNGVAQGRTRLKQLSSSSIKQLKNEVKSNTIHNSIRKANYIWISGRKHVRSFYNEKP